MNAPEAGTIKEYLANEEDTVTVGQDLLKLELGGAPKGGDKQDGGQNPKAPASDNQSTSSDPEPKMDEGTSGQDSSSTPTYASTPLKKETEPSKQQGRKQSGAESELPVREQSSSKSSDSDKPESKNTSSKAAARNGPYGNREERRVCCPESIDVFADMFSLTRIQG